MTEGAGFDGLHIYKLWNSGEIAYIRNLDSYYSLTYQTGKQQTAYATS